MNWKLIFQLSMFGLIMAFGTISLIPEKVEFIFWLFISIAVAYVIAKVCTGKYFAHGFFVSGLNSVYLTTTHTFFYTSYSTHHPDMSKMMPAGGYLIGYMIGIGLISAIVFGLFQGLFALIASKLVKQKTPLQ
ncbi:hypothetical protein BDD43_0947 [Mucilaginibacter gracilis]|uniref:Uncharacterized protein n=1 Tax=Mucilaginibacter gracilis TaxID=423350 RepID=A0A495IW51_9SPHI|nr:hypothetical protein [Mucilaginibacter gracilis]RKR80812.1 hypothetical protein BDD43_0947 [Mucilaginibacter gracilis]